MERSRSADPAPGRSRDALLSFAIVIALAMVVYVALFDVSSAVETVIFVAILVGGIGVLVAVNLSSTPTGQLPRPEATARRERHAAMLSGALVAVLVLLAYTAAFELDSWSEWVVFGALLLATAGGMIAYQTR